MSREPIDFPETLAVTIYGKTDRVNSPQNQSLDFKDGYYVGSMAKQEDDSFDFINAQWTMIGRPEELPESFTEWKRGFWAARMQKTWASCVDENKKPFER